MGDNNVQLKVSVVNVPDDLSPLKLPGYLRREATEIQNMAAENCYAVIRLLLPDRIRYGYTPKMLDALIDDIVNRFPCIRRIELVPVKLSLNAEQMEEENLVAQGIMEEMIEGLKRFEAENKDPKSTVH